MCTWKEDGQGIRAFAGLAIRFRCRSRRSDGASTSGCSASPPANLTLLVTTSHETRGFFFLACVYSFVRHDDVLRSLLRRLGVEVAPPLAQRLQGPPNRNAKGSASVRKKITSLG